MQVSATLWCSKQYKVTFEKLITGTGKKLEFFFFKCQLFKCFKHHKENVTHLHWTGAAVQHNFSRRMKPKPPTWGEMSVSSMKHPSFSSPGNELRQPTLLTVSKNNVARDHSHPIWSDLTPEDFWPSSGSNLPILTIQPFTELTLCPNNPVVWGVFWH